MDSSVGSRVKRRAGGRRGRRGVILYLPEDILANILSWLPADDVQRCRCVCRAWRDFTSTQEFVNSHLNRQLLTAPSIFIDTIRPEDRHFIVNWWEPTETRQKHYVFSKFVEYNVHFSHGGLIVLRHRILPLKLIIFNPANGEFVTIMFLKVVFGKPEKYPIYGVFFHPLLKEYCMIMSVAGKYKLLVMGSTPYLKDIDPPLGTIWYADPVLVNDHLYWMADPYLCKERHHIIEFNLRSEEFVLIPCPTPINSAYREGVGMLNIDGLVSLVKLSIEEKLLITIWTLTDPPRKLWTTSSSYSINTQGYKWHGPLRPLALAEEQLLFRYGNKTFVCNLKSNTMRSFNIDMFDVNCFSHVTTVASLRKCKSQVEAGKTTSETSGGRIQIIWEQLNKAQAQKALVSDTYNEDDSS